MKTYILTGKAHLFTLVILLLNLFFLNNKTFAQETNSEIFNIVDEMPRFPGCEEKSSIKEKVDCSVKKLMEYIYANVRYPEEAIQNDYQGRVTLRFVVNTDSTISNVEILKDIGGGCGEEAKKVIESMNSLLEKWIPGKQDGRNVNVWYTFPIVFKLNNDLKSSNSQKINTQVSDNANSSSPCDQIPIFPLCTNLPTRSEMAECTPMKMMEFIYSNLKYPSVAISLGIEGRVILSFRVNTEGKIDNVEIVKNIGGGCGEEAKRALLMSNKLPGHWLPGLKDGKPIDSPLTVPVIFKLNG